MVSVINSSVQGKASLYHLDNGSLWPITDYAIMTMHLMLHRSCP